MFLIVGKSRGCQKQRGEREEAEAMIEYQAQSEGAMAIRATAAVSVLFGSCSDRLFLVAKNPVRKEGEVELLGETPNELAAVRF